MTEAWFDAAWVRVTAQRRPSGSDGHADVGRHRQPPASRRPLDGGPAAGADRYRRPGA